MNQAIIGCCCELIRTQKTFAKLIGIALHRFGRHYDVGQLTIHLTSVTMTLFMLFNR